MNTDKPNKPITKTKTETEIKTFPTKTNPGPDGFTAEFYQTLPKGQILTLLKLSKAIERERIVPNSYEARGTLLLRIEKETTKKRNYT